MRTRPLVMLAAASAVLSLAATSATAASCDLVKDAANDAGVGASASPAKANTIDIRSVDAATGKKTLVVVLKLGSTAFAAEPLTAPGLTMSVAFSIRGVSHRLTRQYGPNGAVSSDTFTIAGKAVTGAKVAVAGNAVTWTIPRGSVAALRGKGAVVTGFFASTSSRTLAFDQAPDNGSASQAEYKDLAKSCVKAS